MSSDPGIDDFVLWMFQQAIGSFRSDRPGGLRNIQLDFNSLRFDLRSQSALATLAKRVASSISYASTIENADFRDLVGIDLFEEVDQKIISDLAREVAARTATAREVADVVRKRKSSIWAEGYRKLYAAIESGSELLSELSALTLTITSFDDGLDRYRRQWYRIDQLYRQYTVASQTAEFMPRAPPSIRSRWRSCEARWRSSMRTSSCSSWATPGSLMSTRLTSGGQPCCVRRPRSTPSTSRRLPKAAGTRRS